MGSKNRTKLDLLKAQLRQYACNETPYNETYVTNIDTPLQAALVAETNDDLEEF
ncbi:6003_t:CDS:2 [Entrophospora sp. SA101]|nr:6003_t:CDS:2 [Entrophospora sp. SA101]